MGFEPTGDIMPSAVFKTAALNRSATPPWSRCGDLNPKPADYKSAALPIELRRHSGRRRVAAPPAPLKEITPLYQIPILGCSPYPRTAFHESVTVADAYPVFHTAAKAIQAAATFYIAASSKSVQYFFAKNYGRSERGHNFLSCDIMLCRQTLIIGFLF